MVLLNFNWKKWYNDFLKSNSIDCLFLINIVFSRVVQPFMVVLCENYLSKRLADNVLVVVVAFYCYILKSLLQKFCWIYYEFLLKESTDIELNKYRITIFMRFSCCYYVAINSVVILGMKLDNWGGWLLIFNYMCFLVKSYTNWDIFNYLFDNVKRFFKKNVKKQENSKNLIEFRKIFAGCALDVQIICIMRLLVIFFLGRWSTGPGDPIFYKNCHFQIIDTYQMNFWGLVFLVSTNLIIIAVFLIYMKLKKSVFIYYKPYSLKLNVFVFFALHFFLEDQIQLSSAFL